MEDINVNKSLLLDISSRVAANMSADFNEEATKQYFILPFFSALGYNPWSQEDVRPEYTLDVGIKSGEKVDYVLFSSGKPVILVECKAFGVELSEKYISQLYRYFSVSTGRIAVLTNGNDYWFFSDVKKSNVMDLTPYYSFRMSDISDVDIERMALYSKSTILDVSIAKLVDGKMFKDGCRALVSGLFDGNIPDWQLDFLEDRYSSEGVTRDELAQFLVDEHTRVLGAIPQKVQSSSPCQVTKSSKSLIQLNHEYVFNDYTDGDWTGHKLGYAIVFGEKQVTSNMRKVFLYICKYILDNRMVTVDSLLNSGLFNGTCKLQRGESKDKVPCAYFEEYDLSVRTNLSSSAVVDFIERLLKCANLPFDTVKFSFKS